MANLLKSNGGRIMAIIISFLSASILLLAVANLSAAQGNGMSAQIVLSQGLADKLVLLMVSLQGWMIQRLYANDKKTDILAREVSHLSDAIKVCPCGNPRKK